MSASKTTVHSRIVFPVNVRDLEIAMDSSLCIVEMKTIVIGQMMAPKKRYPLWWRPGSPFMQYSGRMV